MTTREDILAENKRLKAQYGKLFDEVAEVLFRHDPIGINFEDNTDEYEPEARTILPRLRTCANTEEVIAVVFEEFQKWFGPDIAGGQEKYRPLSKEIWLLWNHNQNAFDSKEA